MNGNQVIRNNRSTCQQKGTYPMKRNSLIATIVPQNIETEQAVKTGTIN